MHASTYVCTYVQRMRLRTYVVKDRMRTYVRNSTLYVRTYAPWSMTDYVRTYARINLRGLKCKFIAGLQRWGNDRETRVFGNILGGDDLESGLAADVHALHVGLSEYVRT